MRQADAVGRGRWPRTSRRPREEDAIANLSLKSWLMLFLVAIIVGCFIGALTSASDSSNAALAAQAALFHHAPAVGGVAPLTRARRPVGSSPS